MVIWKWRLAVVDRQTISVPVGAKVLTVQMQGEECCLWALCVGTPERESRHVAIYGTGNPMPDEPGEYISTFQMHGGMLVFHAFELKP